MVTIRKIEDHQIKSKICEQVLRDLPEWFGIEDSTLAYIKGVKTNIFLAASIEDNDIGFIAFKKHFEGSYEINVMGVLKSHHGQSIGKSLLSEGEKLLKNTGGKFLQVKTLSESRKDENYEKTRKFYLGQGFVPVEEFKTLWDEFNPCLQLIKSL